LLGCVLFVFCLGLLCVASQFVLVPNSKPRRRRASAMADASTALRDQILRDLDAAASGELDLRQYCDGHNVDYKAADGACRGLAAATYTTVHDQSTTTLDLAAESLAYIEHGSPECQFLALVTARGPISQADAIKEAPAAIGKLGLAGCMKNKWIKNDASGNLVRAVEGDVVDVLVNQLRAVREGGELDAAAAKDLKRRKLVKEVKVTTVIVRKGPGFSTTFKKQVADLTKEMLEGCVLFASESTLIDSCRDGFMGGYLGWLGGRTCVRPCLRLRAGVGLARIRHPWVLCTGH
jgi:hypothetical protein